MSKMLALVTGGTRGIGAAISIRLKNAGYDVIASYLSNDELALKFSISENIEVRKWDASDYDECHHNVNQIERDFGSSIVVLINNVGVVRDVMFHKMSHDDWKYVIGSNLNSCYNMCAAIYPKMRINEFGRIVNISSINALSGQVGQVSYSASKAAIIGFTKSLAREAALKNITVNVVAPGYIETEILSAMNPKILERIVESIPVKRLGKPEEVADVVEFLISDKAAFITGATFSINGGQYMM